MADHEEAEGASFEAAFAGLFGRRDQTLARRDLERKASKTPKQRARKATRTVQINVRATPATKALLDALAEHLDCSHADIFEKAIAAFAETRSVRVDADA